MSCPSPSEYNISSPYTLKATAHDLHISQCAECVALAMVSFAWQLTCNLACCAVLATSDMYANSVVAIL